jgi:PAS domain S-box-containing protein
VHQSKPSNKVDEMKCPMHLEHIGDEVMQLARAFQNMTIQLKRSQQELSDSEANYRSLFNSGPNPIFVIDRLNLDILDVNPTAIRMFGYNPFELAASRFSELGKFEYEDQDLSEMVKKGWPRGYIFRQNARLYKRGSHIPLYLRMKAVPTRYQNRDALVLALTNITATVEKDVQLIQASKMSSLGEMSAGIAHELNQPLNAIKLGNDFLLTMLDQQIPIPDADLKQVTTEVNNQVARAARIINRLRDFGRQTDFAKERVNINDSVKGVLKLIGPQLDIDNVRIDLKLNENLPLIMVHRNRMDQILFNLLANARDAINQLQKSGKEGRRQIDISTDLKHRRVILFVSDSGIGIPEELRNRIFEPFFTTKEVGKGMGLGLAIIYSMVKDYGGKISAHGRKEGGTTFKLAFPATK